MDVLSVVAEAIAGVSESRYPEIQSEIRGEIRAKLGVDPVVDLVPPSTRLNFRLPRCEKTILDVVSLILGGHNGNARSGEK